MRTIRELQIRAFNHAKKSGFWDNPENNAIPTKIALMHSELSEALEWYRKPEREQGIVQSGIVWTEDGDKPDGFYIELADVVIRIMDLCQAHQVDLEELISLKMSYNESRPPMHGGFTDAWW